MQLAIIIAFSCGLMTIFSLSPV